LNITREQLVAMAQAVGLTIPEADLENVRVRLTTALAAMEEIERVLGAEMDRVDPVPPVYPHEPF
jgi:hypothetical protein